MDRDPIFDYGPNGPAVAAIIKQASEMTSGQMAAADTALGVVSGYVGIKKSWVDAQKAVYEVAQAHARMGPLTLAKDAAMQGVMTAALNIVTSKTNSNLRVAERWQDYLVAVAAANRRRRRRAYRNLQQALRGAVGAKVAKSIPQASGAASLAAQVAVIWDLANERNQFTPTVRDLLMSPWLAAYPLPPEFATRP